MEEGTAHIRALQQGIKFSALEILVSNSNRLFDKEVVLEERTQKRRRERFFYLWFSKFYSRLQDGSDTHQANLKRKVLLALDENRRRQMVAQSRACSYYN